MAEFVAVVANELEQLQDADLALHLAVIIVVVDQIVQSLRRTGPRLLVSFRQHPEVPVHSAAVLHSTVLVVDQLNQQRNAT